MSELRTDFKDEILQEGEEHRIYSIKRKGTDEIVESDIYLEKAYTPLQEGDNFGAKEVNEIHGRLNGLAPQNLLINGDFKIWQRGTTFSDVANQYTADMWRIANASASVALVERSTDVPSNADCDYSIHIKDTQSNPNFYLRQTGMNFKGSFVLSFWYKSNKNLPTYYIDTEGEHLLGVNEPSSEWKYVSYKFTADNLSTLNIIQGASNGDFYIASVRLYRGEIDYPHVAEDDATALMRCQQYIKRYIANGNVIYHYLTNKRYLIDVPLDEMAGTPTLSDIVVKWYSDSGRWITGNVIEALQVNRLVTFYVSYDGLLPINQYSLTTECVFTASCEPL